MRKSRYLFHSLFGLYSLLINDSLFFAVFRYEPELLFLYQGSFNDMYFKLTLKAK